MCKLCNHSFLHYHNYQRIFSIPCIYISNIPKGVSDTITEIALKNKLCKSIFPVLTEYGFIQCEWEPECVGMRGDGSYK